MDSDAAEIARTHVATWKGAYRGLVDDAFLDRLSPADHIDAWRRRISGAREGRTEVAIERGRVLGFVTFGPARAESAGPQVGEIYSLYVHPRLWGRGVGKALYARARAALRESGCRELIVWAMQGHEQSLGFYRSRGLSDEEARKQDHPPGGIVLDLRRLRGRIDEAQPRLSGRWVRRAALRSLFLGCALALFPGGLFVGAMPGWFVPFFALAALGLTAFLPTLVEGAWRSGVGRKDLSVLVVSVLAATLSTLAVVASGVYASQLWASGGDLPQAIGALIKLARGGGAWVAWLVGPMVVAPWCVLLGAAALGDLDDFPPGALMKLLVWLPLATGICGGLVSLEAGVVFPLTATAFLLALWVFGGAAILRVVVYASADRVEQRLWPLV